MSVIDEEIGNDKIDILVWIRFPLFGCLKKNLESQRVVWYNPILLVIKLSQKREVLYSAMLFRVGWGKVIQRTVWEGLMSGLQDLKREGEQEMENEKKKNKEILF